MGKKLIITENERSRILDLYGILKESLNEATPTTPTSSTSSTDLTMNEKITFGPGWYGQKFSYKSKNGTTYSWDVEATLKPGLDKIKEFLKNNPSGYIVDILFKAGESYIPNNDQVAGGDPVKPGHLNDKRLETLKKYITPVFDSWKKEGINVPFDIKEEKKIGPTPWVGTPFCPEGSSADTQRNACFTNYLKMLSAGNAKVKDLKNKYDGEQNFEVFISVNALTNSPETTKCMTNMEIQINYTDLSKTHTCNDAVYTVLANGIKLLRDDGAEYASLANANGQYDNNPDTCATLNRDKSKGIPGEPKFLSTGGAKSEKCKRFNTFKIDNALANKILGSSDDPRNPKIKLEATCLMDSWYNGNTKKWTGGCHEGVGNIVIINGKGEKFNFNSATPNGFNETKILALLDPCGKKVS